MTLKAFLLSYINQETERPSLCVVCEPTFDKKRLSISVSDKRDSTCEMQIGLGHSIG